MDRPYHALIFSFCIRIASVHANRLPTPERNMTSHAIEPCTYPDFRSPIPEAKAILRTDCRDDASISQVLDRLKDSRYVRRAVS